MKRMGEGGVPRRGKEREEEGERKRGEKEEEEGATGD